MSVINQIDTIILSGILPESDAILCEFGNYSLNMACRCGDLDIVKHLVDKGVTISNYNTYIERKYFSDPNTEKLDCASFPLLWATRYGHLNIVKYLHEQGMYIMHNCNMPIILASTYGHLDVVKYLNEHGDGDHTAYGCRAIKRAAKNGHLEIVKCLVDGWITEDNLVDVLIAACKRGHLEIVKYMIDLDAITECNKCAFDAAIVVGSLEIAEYLCDELAANDTDLREYYVYRACEESRLSIVKYLHRTGPIPNSSLRYACHSVEITKYLCEVANVKPENTRIMYHVTMHGISDVLKYLINIPEVYNADSPSTMLSYAKYGRLRRFGATDETVKFWSCIVIWKAWKAYRSRMVADCRTL